jgi:arginyl-tRNA synthetase
MVISAGKEYSPALIANYIYDLAKEFNRFYQETPIFKEGASEKQIFRLLLSAFIADIIKKGMSLLGIQVPERM